MNLDYTPTCEELRLRKQLQNKFDNLHRFMFARYKKGRIVKFRFNNLVHQGRVTNVISRSGLYFYNIETESGKWYREIDTQDIISTVNP